MPAVPGSKQYHYLALFMGAVLIFGAATAVFQPAGEYPPSPMHFVEMGLDLLMTILLPVFLIKNLPAAPDDGLKTAATLIGWAGVVGGLIQLGARISSNHGWWTGHYGAPVFN